MRTIAAGVLGLLLILPGAAEGQLGGNLSLEGYAGYAFFGDLPETAARLEGDYALGVRGAWRVAPQWSVFGNFQRSTPAVTGSLTGISGGEVDVDHWSAGVEFAYVPRGGAEGMLPILLEAGLGQTRYEGGTRDLAVNIGIGSALQLTPDVALRYGANDYVSNYRNGRGVVHQVTVRVGGEVRL